MLVIIFSPHIISIIADPTNLLIRLNNWYYLFESYINFPSDFLFGKGIVQNGSFGPYHSVIIDNVYIGVFLTGGVISLFLFLSVVALLLKIITQHQDGFTTWRVAVVLGMLGAGFFENVMHILYLFIFPLFLYSIPKTRELRKNYD